MDYRVLNTSTLSYLIITLPMPPPIDATMVLTAALKRRKEMTIKKDRNVYLLDHILGHSVLTDPALCTHVCRRRSVSCTCVLQKGD